jgi:4'-phosphopantetheinyl transferase
MTRSPARSAIWAPGPRRPVLPPRAVHVWRVDLTAVSDSVTAALSPDERARMGRFVRVDDGRRWARARGVLRALLARYLHVEPASLEFSVGPHGKLLLTGRRERTSLAFNLSHSRALALYAFSHAGACGVDVEVDRARSIDELALARRTLGATEAQRLASLKAEQRRREFLRAWTRHEASLKCRGAGLCEPRDPTGLERVGGRVWIAKLEPGGAAAGALAVGTPPQKLALFDWRE